jgi:hypothetical protein
LGQTGYTTPEEVDKIQSPKVVFYLEEIGMDDVQNCDSCDVCINPNVKADSTLVFKGSLIFTANPLHVT